MFEITLGIDNINVSGIHNSIGHNIKINYKSLLNPVKIILKILILSIQNMR